MTLLFSLISQSNASRSDATKRFVPDELKTDSASLDNFNVMPREVAVAIRPAFDDVLQRSPASYRARELNIFTCANHMPILYAPKDVGGATDAAKKAHLMRHWLDYARSQIVFVGCPLTQVRTVFMNSDLFPFFLCRVSENCSDNLCTAFLK